jgi:hypothetical protein
MKKSLTLLLLSFTLFVCSQTKQESKENSNKKGSVMASFGQHKGNSTITIEELKTLNDLSLISPSASKSYVVLSYEVNVRKGGTLKSFSIQGQSLTKESKEYLLTCSSGTNIFIEEIKIKDESGKQSKAAGITLVVK